jgi:hypothetical protein
MPAETLVLDSASETYQSQEIHIDAADFCAAFSDVSNLQRHATASVLHVKPNQLSAGNLARHLNEDNAEGYFKKIDHVVNSEQMASHIEQCISNGNYHELLSDEHMFSYILDLARTGFVGGIIDGLLDSGAIPQHKKRVYRERLIEMNHAFKDLADSGFSRDIGMTRHGLKEVIGKAYGAKIDQRSAELTEKVEMGVAAEVATKRYIETAGRSTGLEVRYATAEEDAKKMDVVCVSGSKLLGIDVKSGDKHSPKGDERAWSSPIEEFDIGEYRVRELYPAKESCIGNNFEIKAEAYKKKIDEVLEDFRGLY